MYDHEPDIIRRGAQLLQAKRKKEEKTCPECGAVRIAVIRASDLCPKCKDKIRKRNLKKSLEK
jgi:uncharacterized paraquat-inducible protein A